jgi:hypothetical protein
LWQLSVQNRRSYPKLYKAEHIHHKFVNTTNEVYTKNRNEVEARGKNNIVCEQKQLSEQYTHRNNHRIGIA